MRFNAAKCNIMRVSRSRNPKLFNYSLTGQVLEEVMDAKYLGVTLGNDLEWSKHIATMTNKANSKLSFLCCNLKGCPEKLKQTAYLSLIRSFMEYGATVWDPYQTISAYTRWNCLATVYNYRCQQTEINTYPDSLPFISTGFLPRVSSMRLN